MQGLPQFRRAWSHSTLLRIGIVLAAVSLVALALIVSATVFADRSTGKAGAINAAGALRMQSYALATQVARLDGDAESRRAAIAAAIAGFEARVTSAALAEAVVSAGQADVRERHAAVLQRWQGLRPLAVAAADDAAARAAYLGAVDGFVAGIDAFVQALEHELEARIRLLRFGFAAGFVLMLALVAAILLLLRIEVFQPIARLVDAARRVRGGDFEVRAAATGADEIGQLGQSFNMMVQALAQLTGSLERQVAERTEELARRHRSLVLLFDATRELTGGTAGPAEFGRVLDSMHGVLGIEAAALYVVPPGAELAEQVVATGPMPPLPARPWAAAALGQAPAMRVEASAEGERRVVSVPLLDGGACFGSLELALPPGRAFEQWQTDLVATLGRHFGAAAAAGRRRDEHRRLGVLEERSAIARELHDSIAQALAYTQIQAARLAATLRQDGNGPAAAAVLDELREGLAHAYRQLRELLATFRLQVGAQGLGPALHETLADFQRRSGVAARLDDELAGVVLDINQQIHVLQIVREALSNVEHHADARHAQVRLRRDGDGDVVVTVDDDGSGIAVDASPDGHFGLAIMRDRAALLDGHLAVARRAPPARGTRVVLRFALRGATSATATPAAASGAAAVTS